MSAGSSNSQHWSLCCYVSVLERYSVTHGSMFSALSKEAGAFWGSVYYYQNPNQWMVMQGRELNLIGVLEP